MSKQCSKCGQVKSLSAFGRMGKNRDGSQRYNAACKGCIKAKNAAYYLEHAPELKARASRYHAEHRQERNERARDRRERKARVRASQRRYYWRNRDARIAQSAAWREANRERLAAYYKGDAQNRREYQREWRRANPERIRAYRQAQPARTRNDFLAEWRKAPVRAHQTTPGGALQA